VLDEVQLAARVSDDGLAREVLGVDRLISLKDARRRTGDEVALHDNLDPVILYGSPEAIRTEVRRTLGSYAHGGDSTRTGHIFNLFRI
jgi:uroporphyrinogen decarboxylase